MTKVYATMVTMVTMVSRFTQFVLLLATFGSSLQLHSAETAQALEDLRAANQARSEAAAELQAWEAERQRLSLLLAESRRQQTQLREQEQRDRQAIEQFQKRLAQLDSKESKSLALDTVLMDLSQHVDERLDKKAHVYPSSSISVKQELAADAAMQFMRSSARLDKALQHSKQWQVSLSDGVISGQTLVYDQLRMGNVCAWWASRDAQRAGFVLRQDGINNLQPIEDPQLVARIVEAIAIVRGDRSPRLLSLPVHPKLINTAQAMSSVP